MTGAAAIVADFHRSVALLAEIDDPAALRVAEALSRWLLAGEDFESAAGLAPGWRRHLQQAARDVALQALLALHPRIDAQRLAERIAAGVQREADTDGARPDGARPDGARGYHWDLARAGVRLSERSWRRLIAEAHGQTDHALATTALSVWSAPKLLEK